MIAGTIYIQKKCGKNVWQAFYVNTCQIKHASPRLPKQSYAVQGQLGLLPSPSLIRLRLVMIRNL